MKTSSRGGNKSRFMYQSRGSKKRSITMNKLEKKSSRL